MDENINNSKPKNYYSLNLTEGRIFIIFITVLIVIALIIFGAAFIISNKKPVQQPVTNVQTEDPANNELAENYLYYQKLSNSINNNSLTNNSSSSSSSSSNMENNLKNSSKINNNKKDDSEIPELKESNNIDNSEILYSSKTVKKEETKISSNKNQSVNNKISKTKSNSNENAIKSTDKKMRYIIQVGSYINKKTAQDISQFYEKQGYPVFMKEKTTNGKLYYRLRIGPFKEKDSASNYLAKIKTSKYGKDCYISVVYL